MILGMGPRRACRCALAALCVRLFEGSGGRQGRTTGVCCSQRWSGCRQRGLPAVPTWRGGVTGSCTTGGRTRAPTFSSHTRTHANSKLCACYQETHYGPGDAADRPLIPVRKRSPTVKAPVCECGACECVSTCTFACPGEEYELDARVSRLWCQAEVNSGLIKQKKGADRSGAKGTIHRTSPVREPLSGGTGGASRCGGAGAYEAQFEEQDQLPLRTWSQLSPASRAALQAPSINNYWLNELDNVSNLRTRPTRLNPFLCFFFFFLNLCRSCLLVRANICICGVDGWEWTGAAVVSDCTELIFICASSVGVVSLWCYWDLYSATNLRIQRQ